MKAQALGGRFNFCKPRQMYRSIRYGDANLTGVNFCVKFDSISNYGEHLGTVVRLDRDPYYTSNRHDLLAIRGALKRSHNWHVQASHWLGNHQPTANS
jgi:hypothetical protein